MTKVLPINESLCIQCDQKDIILKSSVCLNCDRMNRKNDFLQNDGTIVIDKNNINLYYEFILFNDLTNYSAILEQIFTPRIDKLLKEFNLSNDVSDDYYMNELKVYEFSKNCIVYDAENEIVKASFFGIDDNLKEIEEYISEVKESARYKKYMEDLCPICKKGTLLEDKESIDSGCCSNCGEKSYF